jgi:HK97 family phage major capsid protein
MLQQLPQALSKKFDQTVFGYSATPGTGFDTLLTAPQVSINTANTGYAGLITALDTIATAGGELSDILGSSQATSKFLGQLDTTGRPLFQGNLLGLGGSLLGVPYVPSRHVHKASGAGAGNSQVLAIAGDWAGSAFWGQVGAISVSVADQATILDSDGTTLLNLWQRNMFAVRVEVELGFAVKDVNRFVKLTGTPNS